MIFFASCAANQMDIVKEELTALGVSELRVGAAGVEFVANLEQAYRFTMTTRIASRVLQALYFDDDIQSADEL